MRRVCLGRMTPRFGRFADRTTPGSEFGVGLLMRCGLVTQGGGPFDRGAAHRQPVVAWRPAMMARPSSTRTGTGPYSCGNEAWRWGGRSRRRVYTSGRVLRADKGRQMPCRLLWEQETGGRVIGACALLPPLQSTCVLERGCKDGDAAAHHQAGTVRKRSGSTGRLRPYQGSDGSNE